MRFGHTVRMMKIRYSHPVLVQNLKGRESLEDGYRRNTLWITLNGLKWLRLQCVTFCEHLKDRLVTGFHTSSHFIDQLFSYRVSRRVLHREVTHMYVIAQYVGLINKILNTNYLGLYVQSKKYICLWTDFLQHLETSKLPAVSCLTFLSRYLLSYAGRQLPCTRIAENRTTCRTNRYWQMQTELNPKVGKHV